ncbi:MAG: hypothetical protein NDJ92_11680 [Thermoanaerobaculia bacterium]|nr:hypothetical protein [Thermoanaerobaculia bacterium]
MVDQEEMEDEEFESQLEQMIVENGMLIQSVMNILLRKGIITEDEVDRELETLYKELGDEGEEPAGE